MALWTRSGLWITSPRRSPPRILVGLNSVNAEIPGPLPRSRCKERERKDDASGQFF